MEGLMTVYTAIQQKILLLLSDGLPHRSEEVKTTAGYDQHDSKAPLHNQISLLRKLLRIQGQDITCHYDAGETWYRLLTITTREQAGYR